MRGSFRWMLVLFVLSACQEHEPEALLSGEIVDLTHPFDGTTIYWPTEDGFQLDVGTAGYTEKGYFYAANRFQAAEHGGTHIDAPIHFAEGKLSVDEIPLSRLVGPGVVVDVTSACEKDPDYQVTVDDIRGWEKEHGPLPDGVILLIRTGFGKHWPQRTSYMGTDLRGDEGVASLHFPGLHPDAARFLATEREVAAVGLDTPSIDHGPSTLFETHQILFSENIPALENVNVVDQLGSDGFTVVALPMLIRGGTGSPLRVVAILAPTG